MSNVHRFHLLKWAYRARNVLPTMALAASGLLLLADFFPAIARAGIPTLPRVELCHGADAANCVIDGDTIRWRGDIIRLQDIDAPEIGSYRCASELVLGNRATARLRDLLNADPVEIRSTGGRDEDVYGRKLRLVTDGRASFGDILVAEGLARPWDGARRGWCA